MTNETITRKWDAMEELLDPQTILDHLFSYWSCTEKEEFLEYMEHECDYEF